MFMLNLCLGSFFLHSLTESFIHDYDDDMWNKQEQEVDDFEHVLLVVLHVIFY